MKNIILILLLMLLIMTTAWAQGEPVNSGGSVIASPPSESVSTYLTKVSKETSLPIVSIIFGVIALIAISWLSLRDRIEQEDTPRYILLTLIVVGALVFVSGGFGEKEITSAIGLFGSIAGYLLGKAGSGKAGANDAKSEA